MTALDVPEWYPESRVVRCVPKRYAVHATSGEETVSAEKGRLDGVCYLSRTRDGAAISTLSITLTEATDGGVYFGTFSGTVLRTALATTPDGTVLYRRTAFGTNEGGDTVPILWRTVRS